jgi:hypothetical protein
MPITAKPFSRALKLARMIFKPRPNVFSDQDLNRAFDMSNDKTEQAIAMSGGTKTNWEPSVGGIVVPTVGATYVDLVGLISFTKVDAGQAAYTNFNGVQFTMPIVSINVESTNTIPVAEWKNLIYICLIATKTTANSTVNSTEFPTALPGPDIETWGSERLAWTWKNPSTISLGANEYLIGIVATWKYSPNWKKDSDDYPVLNDTVLYSMESNVKDTSNNFLATTNYGTPTSYIFDRFKSAYTNGSLYEFLVALIRTYAEDISKVWATTVSTITPTKLWATLKYNGNQIVTLSANLAITDGGNYFTIDGTGSINHIKSYEVGTNEGTLIVLKFLAKATLNLGASSPPTGYKPIYNDKATLVEGDYQEASISFPANTVVYIREKYDSWFVENVITPDGKYDELFGMSAYHATLFMDSSESTQSFTISSAVALLKFNGTTPTGQYNGYYNSAFTYNETTGEWTVPKTGVYRFTSVMNATSTHNHGTKALIITIPSRDSEAIAITHVETNGEHFTLCGSREIALTKGQVCTFKMITEGDASGTLSFGGLIIGANNIVVDTLDISYLGMTKAQGY